MHVTPKRTCKSECKRYRVKKPASGGRYEAGQGMCLTCDIWIDYHGAHMNDGSAAKVDSVGWFCNCCNFRIRQSPRSKRYKEKFRIGKTGDRKHAYAEAQSEQQERHGCVGTAGIPSLLATRAPHMIKSSSDGSYTKDPNTLQNTSQEEAHNMTTRLRGATDEAKTKTQHGKGPLDFLSARRRPKVETEYEPSTKPVERSVASNAGAKSNPDELVRMVLDEYKASKIADRSLQRELTKEYLRVGSIRLMMERHKDIPKEEIKRHIRTPLRLPEKLRKRNEEGLHADPQLSLQIALSAVNLHDWDAGDDGEEALLTAERISMRLIAEDRSDETKTPGHMRRENIALAKDPVPTPTAVWIAVAALHREYGTKATFSTGRIIEKIKEQDLCNVSDTTIVAHVSSHCVANSPATNKYVHRKTYRVGHGRYKLYKRGDPCHRTRESCNIAPLPFQIPAEYRDLRRWYDKEYCTQP